ncbi:MAG: hypothetical protein DI565_18880 [Ancylobacter novellus]|uniref:Uncharacterized protein n=1 Tax=Ancylobacter novellus TaxID=921 RepID=A0A2W5K4L0_ANCNO|nr:MAG: hypothetical protein DI565_18880 [Ancylobacter novellus]
MTDNKPLRWTAFALAGAMALVTLVPTSAEAGRRYYRNGYYHHHHGNGAAAAAVGVGVLGVLAATAAANADRECWFEQQRVRTASGKVVIRKVKICD